MIPSFVLHSSIKFYSVVCSPELTRSEDGVTIDSYTITMPTSFCITIIRADHKRFSRRCCTIYEGRASIFNNDTIFQAILFELSQPLFVLIFLHHSIQIDFYTAQMIVFCLKGFILFIVFFDFLLLLFKCLLKTTD